jgi:hypothetical protein
MRAIAVFVVLGLVAVRTAAAEPPAQGDGTQKSDKAKKAAAKKEAAKEAKEAAQPASPAPARAPAPGIGLGSMAAQAASAATPADEARERGVARSRRLDLTPQRQFQKIGDRRGKERTSTVGLGDDGSVAVQAVQIGAMVGIFTALSAICANGGCLLPELFGGQDRLGPGEGVGLRDPGQPRSGR